jgi:hypothetical protein
MKALLFERFSFITELQFKCTVSISYLLRNVYTGTDAYEGWFVTR